MHEDSPALLKDLGDAECEGSESEENRNYDEKERVGDRKNTAHAEKENCKTSANGSGNKGRARLRQSFVRIGHATQ